MKNISEWIMKYKKTILGIFIVGVIVSIVLANYVKVNYNMMDYLPDDSLSTIALNKMNEEYDTAIPNLRVVVKDVDIRQALDYKERIRQVEGVKEITWLDDTVSITVPLETIKPKILETYYKDKNAVFTITIDEEKQVQAIEEIRRIIGQENLMAGDSYNTVCAENSTETEIGQIMIFVIPLIFIILIMTTTSWFEPILFLVTIGIAIILNRGTNIFMGEISFVTNAAASILQLAVSMDYSIFLLHRFSEEREKLNSIEEAMKSAMVKSFSSIMSSGLTTVIGFAALILMQFKIGPDMGIVMAKSIALSLLCVLILLPILAVYSYKIIDKTHHRKLVPSVKGFGKLVNQVKIPALVIFLILLVPCNLASNKISFSYGASEIFGDETTKVGSEKAQVEALFGRANQIVLMVPKGELAKEKELTQALYDIPEVTSIVSYVNSVGKEIPIEYVPESKLSSLISAHYSRMLIQIDRPVQGDATFQTIEKLRQVVNNYYPNTYQMCGESVNTYDMKTTVIQDNVVVNTVAIISIGIILLINFKSLSLPLILLLVIELSIWINLSVPYFTEEHLNYISYLIISSIQLGATIDYAILFTDRYLENRKVLTKKQAVVQTMQDTAISILTSAGILTIAGFFLGNMSTNQVISELGILVGRGAIISTTLVFFVLPSLLTLLDKVIQKTTRHCQYKQEEEEKEYEKII